jgi:transcriptional regulator with XRE-family HTH domain
MSRPMDQSRETAANLRAAMGRRRLSRKDLAYLLGENEMWVGRRVNGKTPITIDDLDRFARALSVPMNELLTAS